MDMFVKFFPIITFITHSMLYHIYKVSLHEISSWLEEISCTGVPLHALC